MNSGGYTYWGYYGLQDGCGGVGLAQSNDLVNWTKYSGNPLFLNGRWPSVLKVGNTLYMLYTRDFCARSYIKLATSTDGITFTDLKTIVQPHSGFLNQNPNLFLNPNDDKYYLYWFSGDAGTWNVKARSASSPTALDDTSSEVTLLSSTKTLAAPNMMYYNGIYFLSTEVLDFRGRWNVWVYSSGSPTSGFTLLPGNPVLANGSACMFQYVFGTTLHEYYCKLTETTWTVEHRRADLTAGRLQPPLFDSTKYIYSKYMWTLRAYYMWVLRGYLLAGLLIHKAVWEILKRRSGRQRVVPGGLALKLVKATKVAILVGIVAQTLVPMRMMPISEDALALRAIGTAIYTVGLLVAILARLQLGENWSDIETPQIADGQEVVSQGLYRYLRHPVYLGDLMLLLGLELALNSWLVLGALALIPIVSRRAIREEKLLAEQLPGYDAYMRRTKRFIPFVV